MKVLLTGSTGFFGRIIKFNLETNHQVFDLSFFNEKSLRLDKDVPNILGSYDLIIHNAGKAHSIPKDEFESKHFFDVNVVGTQNLLEGLEKSALPKKIVFISSVSVYGRKCGFNIPEEELLTANDPYGLSKIQAEKLIYNWCLKNGVICTILRLPLLVGENPPGNLGSMVKAIKKGYYFNIGGGTARKSMVLAQDVALFIPIISSTGGIYNLTDGDHPTLLDLSMALAKSKVPNMPIFIANIFGFLGDLIGNKSPINSLKVKKITSDLTFDDSKARSMGWKPKSVLEYLKSHCL